MTPLAEPRTLAAASEPLDAMGSLKQYLAGRPVIITIDGPAAVGKGTVSKMLARRGGLQILDTGKMYRAVTLAAMDEGIPTEDADRLTDLIRRARISFEWSDDPPAVFAFGRPQGHRLSSEAVENRVSAYAGVPAVRRALIEEQRRLATEHPRLVCDGRDQGAVVFPDAHVKFFLSAPAEVRARRHAMRHGRGDMKEGELEALAQKIRDRDELDVRNGALIQPADAVVLNSAGWTADQTVDEMEKAIRERLAPADLPPRPGV
jgi:cytidylate kinase